MNGMANRALYSTILLLLTLSLYLSAQDKPIAQSSIGGMNGGSVTGSVRTVDDRPVSNARVELRDNGTGASVGSTYTNESGMFELYNINPGDYEVLATQGTSETHEGIRLTGNIETTVSLRMSVAGVAPAGAGATVSVSTMKVPEKASKECEKASEAFHDNKLDEARKHVEKALSIYPNYAEALVIRGIIAVGDQKMDEGQADLQQAIKADPNYGMAYIAMGAALNEQHKFQDARRTLERGIALSPNLWQGYFETSKAAMGMEDYDGALKNVERAASLAKDEYPPLHLIKAHALMGLRRFDEAVPELEQFLSRDPMGPNSEHARLALDKAKAFAASNGGSK